MLKLIFLVYRVNLGSNYEETMGFQFSDPSTPPLGGPVRHRPLSEGMVACNNEKIVTRYVKSKCDIPNERS